jgi:hypothetical protein
MVHFLIERRKFQGTCSAAEMRERRWEYSTHQPRNLRYAQRLETADRTAAAKQYKLTFPLEHDFKPMIHESRDAFKYRLVTVIKKLRSGDYATFVRADDGKWWRCINEEVRGCRNEEW